MSEETPESPRFAIPDAPAGFKGRWEYFFARGVYLDEIQAVLTEAGAKGWQIDSMVSVTGRAPFDGESYRIVFKRPLADPA